MYRCRFRNQVDDIGTRYETLKPSVVVQLPHLQQPILSTFQQVSSQFGLILSVVTLR